MIKRLGKTIDNEKPTLLAMEKPWLLTTLHRGVAGYWYDCVISLTSSVPVFDKNR